MKIDIITKAQARDIAKDVIKDRFDYTYKELTRLRNHILRLEEEIKILKNKI